MRNFRHIAVLAGFLLTWPFMNAREEWTEESNLGTGFFIQEAGVTYEYYPCRTKKEKYILNEIRIGNNCEVDTIDVTSSFTFGEKEFEVAEVAVYIGFETGFSPLTDTGSRSDFSGSDLWSKPSSNRGLHLNINNGLVLYRVSGNNGPITVTVREGVEIKLNDGVAVFGTGVTAVDFKTPITSIPGNFFDGSWLKEFDFAPVTSVGDYAFRNSRLTSADLSHITTIGTGAFAGSSLESVVMPDSLEYIGAGVFQQTQLSSLDMRRTVLDHTNADIVKDCGKLTTLIAPNLKYLTQDAFSGTLIDRIDGYPNLEVICEPKSGRFKKINAPAARNIELRYALIDSLIIGPQLADRTFGEVAGEMGSNSIYKDAVFPGIQPGNSWIGYIEVDEANPDFYLDNDLGLIRRNRESRSTLPIKYLLGAMLSGEEPTVGNEDPWNGNPNPMDDYTTPVVTRAVPVPESSLYRSSETLPGGTVLCDKIDTVFIDTPITTLKYSSEGNVYIPSDDREFYRRLSLGLTSKRKDNPVLVYIHPDVKVDEKSLEMMISQISHAPMGIGTKNGVMPSYGFFASDDVKKSFRFITSDIDEEGVIDRLMSGLDEVITGGRLNVSINSGHVILSNMMPGDSWRIVSTAGRIVALGTADQSGEASVRLSSSGLYVVTSGTAVRKIAVH